MKSYMIAVEFVFTPEHQGKGGGGGGVGWERVSPPVRTFLFIHLGFETKFLVVHCNVEFYFYDCFFKGFSEVL